MFDLQRIPLYFVQLEVGYVMLLILAITILEALRNFWSHFSVKTSAQNTAAAIAFQYTPLPYTCAARQTQFDLDLQTPIQRIHGMKYLRLEHRAKLMPGVRRRLDKDF
ncbi:hypothetical protein KR222_005814 [Zaprionus bogoriensis]|nr:hypothetical protein KR222_005814 [Zaprionus bogoriensis]